MFRNPVLTRAADIGMLEKVLTQPMPERSNAVAVKLSAVKLLTSARSVLA